MLCAVRLHIFEPIVSPQQRRGCSCDVNKLGKMRLNSCLMGKGHLGVAEMNAFHNRNIYAGTIHRELTAIKLL